jgi:DNA-binding response OmpR family regulator
VIVLAPDHSALRGGAAEFRRFGLSVVFREDIVAALTELVHDRTAMLIVSADIRCVELRDVLEVAVATCGASVLLGLGPATDTATVGTAMIAGVHATVDLPLTAERLAKIVPTLPKNQVLGPITVGSLTVDAGRHRLDWDGVRIDVSPREFAVALELARNHPRIVALDELASRHQKTSADPYGSVRVLINNLRSRIAPVAGADGSVIIETVRGVGYRLAC